MAHEAPPSASTFPSDHGSQLARNLFLQLDTVFALKATILLGVPHVLACTENGGAPLSVAQIAAKLNHERVNLNALGRLLRFVASQGFLHESSTYEDPRYGLTSAFRCLLGSEDLSNTTLLFLTHSANLGAFNLLHEVVINDNSSANDNCSAFERANGKPLFEYAKENPAYDNLFNASMAGVTRATMGSVLKHYTGFKEVITLVDVGGGKGAALCEIVRSYPHIRGINFDQPHVVAHALPITGVEHVGGDMFESVPSANVILIKSILLDWDDEMCLKILCNCHKALPAKGKVIIIEQVIREKLRTNVTLQVDLHMLAFTCGGRLRSEAEWQKLLPKVGFTNPSILYLPDGINAVIETFKQ